MLSLIPVFWFIQIHFPLLPFCLQKWFSTYRFRVRTNNRSTWLVVCRWTLSCFLDSQKPNTDGLCLSILFYASVVRCLSNSKSMNVNMSSDKDLYHMLCDFSDGRPAPPLKGQIRRQKQREDFAVRTFFFLLIFNFRNKLWCLHLCLYLEKSSVSQCRGGWRDEEMVWEEGSRETERRAFEILIAET